VTPPEFSITTAQVGPESYVVALSGEVDMYEAPALERDLAKIATHGGRRVIVDFTSADFIDSSVLGVLVREVERLRPRGGDLLVVSSDPRILRAFEITGLDRMFTIEPNLTDAVAAGAAT
jgi:anti-sigma B factor antagonist